MGLRTIHNAVRKIVRAIGDVQHTELRECEVCQKKCIKIDLQHMCQGGVGRSTQSNTKVNVAPDADLLPADGEQRLSRSSNAEAYTCTTSRIEASQGKSVNPSSRSRWWGWAPRARPRDR
jgi:hypothetical protein